LLSGSWDIQRQKDIYGKLGRKIDSLTARTPWNEAFYSILSELYSHEEADVVTKMPNALSNFVRVKQSTKCESSRLAKITGKSLFKRSCDRPLGEGGIPLCAFAADWLYH
jgi:hypothetical protein